MLALTLNTTKDVAANLRHTADTIDTENAVSPIPRATFLARAWTAANDKARELRWIVDGRSGARSHACGVNEVLLAARHAAKRIDTVDQVH